MLPSLLHLDAPADAAAMPCAAELIADLNLFMLFHAMGRGDARLEKTARAEMTAARAASPAEIRYRQSILSDALCRPEAFYGLYRAAREGVDAYETFVRDNQAGYARYEAFTRRIRAAAGALELLLDTAQRVRAGLASSSAFDSQGMRAYAAAFSAFFPEDFLREAKAACARLRLVDEDCVVEIGAAVGRGLKGTDYVIRRVLPPERGKVRRATAGAVALDKASLQQKAIECKDTLLRRVLLLLDAVAAQTAGILKRFLHEIGFYAGCLNLHAALRGIGVPLCMPEIAEPGFGAFCAPGDRADGVSDRGFAKVADPAYPMPGEALQSRAFAAASASSASGPALSADGLCDPALALRGRRRPTANDVRLDGAGLVLITGANQGGKSTFLRSIGCAAVMARCGMFVAAKAYRGIAHPAVFTHFCRREDERLDSGKLDEELARMGRIVDGLSPRSLILMNESFAATSEREAAAIAAEIVPALRDCGARVFFVTHLYAYARAVEARGDPTAAFLLAQRRADGGRTYEIRPGLPERTSYGWDLYRKMVLGEEGKDAVAAR